MEKKTKSFIKGAAILGAAGLVVKAIGAVYRIPLANIVGVEGMSFYEVAYPYYSWLLVISSAGIPTAISKMVSERASLGNYRGANKVFGMALKMLVVIGIFTSLLLFILSGAIANMSGLPGAALSFKALAPALLFVSVMCAYRGYLQGLMQMGGTAISQVVEQVGKLIVGFTLAAKFLAKGPEYAAMGALIGVSVSELLALISIWLIYRRGRRRIQTRIAASAVKTRESGSSIVKQILVLAIPITLGASIMPLTGIADSALILNTLVDVGFTKEYAQSAYSILRSNVTVFINMPAVLTTALAMSLVPAVSSKLAAKDKKGAIKATRTGLKLALIVGAPCAAGLFVLGQPIIGMLFTRLDETQLELAGQIMRTASIGVLFLSLVQTMTGVIQGFGKPTVAVINLAIGGVLKVVSMLLLMRVQSINIQGAAISTVLCYAVAGILDTLYVVRKSGMSINIIDVFAKPIVSSVIMGLVASFVYGALHTSHPTIATLAAIALAVVVYLVLVVVLRMFSPSDLEHMPGGDKLKKLLYRGRN